MKDRLDYQSAGVDYTPLDHLKRMASEFASSTDDVAKQFGFEIIPESRGESAFLLRNPFYVSALVQEGLGTKNLLLDSDGIEETYPENYSTRTMEQIDWEKPETAVEVFAWDTVACIVNDLATVGAQPVVVCPHWALGSTEWLNDERGRALFLGWLKATSKVRAVYGPGETSVLSGVVNPSAIELSGSGFGVIMPPLKESLGKDITPGDHIILVESSGIHANGLTLARKIASEYLPNGYKEKLPDGSTYGEKLLSPTFLYPPLQYELFKKGADIKYMVNITGHGWRKLMRAKYPFTYVMHTVPPVNPEFVLMQEAGNIADNEMYATFNMGAGYAIILPEGHATASVEICKNSGYQAWDAGVVHKGPKQVIIEPKDIVYSAESLQIR